jgi:hypothetical protein
MLRNGAIRAAGCSTCLLVLLCLPCAAQSQSSTLDAVRALKLPKHPGDVPLYYSACCRERAMEMQSALEGCVHFYKEALGIQVHLVAAVLDKSDYSRVIGTTPNPAAPYGMAGVSDGRHIALIPATDDGVITENLLAAKILATPATLNRLHLLHLSYDQAARRYIMHAALHELGHTLAYQYGIHPPTHWLDELLAHYVAYAYERAKRPTTASIVEAFTTLAAPPRKYTSLEDFESHYNKMDPANFTWYHRQFQARVIEIYTQQGADFLTKVKSEFGTAPSSKMGTAELLSRLEHISPGFRAWAARFSH